MSVPMVCEPYFTVAQVAEMLHVSGATVTRQFESMDGVIDLGQPETMHKRKKRVLRIPRRTLQRYIADRQVKVRR